MPDVRSTPYYILALRHLDGGSTWPLPGQSLSFLGVIGIQELHHETRWPHIDNLLPAVPCPCIPGLGQDLGGGFVLPESVPYPMDARDGRP